MKTFSVAEAQANLPDVLEEVRKGVDVGIISQNQIIQLKPTSVVASDDSYLSQEYGVTPEEWAKFKVGIKTRRRKQKYTCFEGKFDPKNLACGCNSSATTRP
jgi:hypothetical protein